MTSRPSPSRPSEPSRETSVLETKRLVLREQSESDAGFILRLLTEPSFIRHIGDKGVRTIDDARRYILSGPVDSYRRFGFGHYLVESRGSGEPMGICGLMKRETLDDVDVGFAFVPEFWSRGFAFEATSAVLAHARDTLGLQRVVAVVSPGNKPSIRLLEKLGMKFERMVRLSKDEPEIQLFA
jgi:RimJ/RimL family protein N-acetyltransferase